MDAETKLGLIRAAADLTIASIHKHPNGIPVRAGHQRPQTYGEMFDAWMAEVRGTFDELDQPPK